MADGYQVTAPPGTPPPPGDLPLALYADYERKRGGLLHVLHGLLLPAQLLILSRAPLGRWWSPAVLMPLHLAYFAVRGPIWRRLYRQHGHLESEEDVRGLGIWIWAYLALAILMTTLNMKNLPVAPQLPWPTAALWIVTFWVPVMVWGRMPVDWAQFLNTWVLLDSVFRLRDNLGRPTPTIWLVATAWIIFGVVQHVLFARGMRGGARHA